MFISEEIKGMKTAISTIASHDHNGFILDDEGRIVPTIENFYKYCAGRKLMGTKCVKCHTLTCPPRGICHKCLGTEYEWVELTGRGVLLTYTVIHFPPTQFQALAPYAVGIVRLDEGPNLPGMIREINLADLKIGISLEIDFESTIPEEWPKWPRYFFKPRI